MDVTDYNGMNMKKRIARLLIVSMVLGLAFTVEAKLNSEIDETSNDSSDLEGERLVIGDWGEMGKDKADEISK